MHAAVHAQNRMNEFVRLQLAVDALVDLPEDAAGGPSAPHDTYFDFGMSWWVLICTGVNFAAVSAPTRRTVESDADPNLTLEDCIAGMANVLEHLRNLDDGEYSKTVNGMLRARRHVRQRQTTRREGSRPGDACLSPRTRALRRRQSDKTVEAGSVRRPNQRVMGGDMDDPVLTETQYALQVHLAESAVDALRTTPPGSAPDWKPTDQDPQLVGIGEAYSVFHHLAIAYMVGGAQGLARVHDICDPYPPIQPIRALAGLQDTRRRLEELTLEDRATAFAAIDFCLRWFDPVWQ